MGSLQNPSVPATVAQWQKVTVGFAQAQIAGLTNQVTIWTLPAKCVLISAYGNVTQAFSGGTIATITGSVGTAGTPAKYAVAASVASAVQIPGIALALAPESMSGSTAIVAQFISTVGNLSALTAGSMDFYLYISSLE